MGVMARRRLLAALSCALALTAASARADTPPDAAALQAAAEAFEQGSVAYKAEQWELAASRFETADLKVPSERALRMAIRARTAAEQHARAATLAQSAVERYPDDESTRKLADETLAAAAPRLHRLEVHCGKPCVLALGRRAVVGQARRRWIVFVDPGEVTVSASFEGGGSEQQVVTAHAGGDNVLQLVPVPGAPAPIVDPEPDEPAVAPDDGAIAEPDDGPSWVQSPAVFATLLGLTAVVGAVTIWSGVDTLQSPGTDAVREACRGKTPDDCPELDEGKSKQLRTNVLIGVTAGLGIVTVIVAAAATDWNGAAPGRASLAPAIAVGPDGASAVLEGRF
jgi:hypothetical protein